MGLGDVDGGDESDDDVGGWGLGSSGDSGTKKEWRFRMFGEVVSCVMNFGDG